MRRSKTSKMNEKKDTEREFKEKARKLLSMAFFLLVTFLALEVGMRIWLNNFAGKRRFLKYASVRQLQKEYYDAKSRWSAHRYLGHYPTPGFKKGENRHNSLGFRSDEIVQPKPAGEFRVVCLGGSTTYSTGVKNYKMSYPNLLEKELHRRGFQNVNVINANACSHNCFEPGLTFEDFCCQLSSRANDDAISFPQFFAKRKKRAKRR